MYKERYLENTVRGIIDTFKVLYVGGPRQVGKTTMLLHMAKEHDMTHVTLDDLDVRKLAQDDPDLFLQQHPAPLLIDEVQYAPQLFPYIKMRVDASDARGRYWLTGSQQFSVMKNVQESLAGRVGIVDLLGFSWAEAHGQLYLEQPFSPVRDVADPPSVSSPEIFEYIIRGSFPILWDDIAPKRAVFFGSYLQTYIDRDLRDIFGVIKLAEFHTFIQLCAARTGQVLNYSDLARDADISVHAAKEWMGILTSTRQIYLLEPYHANIAKRLVKSPKIYFLDTGLAAYLTKWKSAESLQAGAMAGAFFETFVVSELVKSYLFRGITPPLYYLRDQVGHEIDLLIEEEQTLYPLEIKLASSIRDDDIRNIQYWRSKLPNLGKAVVLSSSMKSYALNAETHILPITSIS